MSEPILVIDLGTHASSAAVITHDQVRLVADPATGSARWPTSVARGETGLVVGGAAEAVRDSAPGWYAAGVRRALDADSPLWLGDRQFTGGELVAAYLRGMVGEAQRVVGARIGRLALALPPGYGAPDPRRDTVMSVAAEVGFPDVELISSSVAAALDPETGLEMAGQGLLLVCDLGATWTVALLQQRGDTAVQLAQETSGAGRDFDQLLMQNLRATLPEAIEPLLAQGGDTGALAFYQVADFVRRIKHRLSEVSQVSEPLPGALRPYQLTRAELERFAEPALRWLLASCRAVVARAGSTMTDIDAIVLTGGCSRLPVARMMLHAGLGRPVWRSSDPELAVVRGAARWASGTGPRRITPERPSWRVEPLCWTVPDGAARLLRWLVGEGQPYPAGARIAQVRTTDDRVYDLTAEREGVLLEHRVAVGAVLSPGTVAATSRCSTALAGVELVRRHHLRSEGGWLLPADRRTVMECEESVGRLRVRDLASGAVVADLRPGHHDGVAHTGRPWLLPDGRWAFVTWDATGRFEVWDIYTGSVVSRFKASVAPSSVLVDEARGRLVAASGKRTIGRYQRDTAAVWDLRTGALVEELVGEDLPRRLAGYAARTGGDNLATEASSPDGRLTAVALPSAGTDAAGAAVSVREVATGQEVFRADGTEACADGSAVRAARVAFSADGKHLLVNWVAATGGWLDIWDV